MTKSSKAGDVFLIITTIFIILIGLMILDIFTDRYAHSYFYFFNLFYWSLFSCFMIFFVYVLKLRFKDKKYDGVAYFVMFALGLFMLFFTFNNSYGYDINPFPPSRCQFGAPLVCSGDYHLYSYRAEFRLNNTLNSDYEVVGLLVTNSTGDFVNCTGFENSVVYVDDSVGLSCGFSEDAEVGKRLRLQFEVYYKEVGTEEVKSLPGEIYSEVEKD